MTRRPAKAKPTTPLIPADPTLWQAWVDGSAVPNPGKIGIGIVLYSPTGVCIEHSSQVPPGGCNNEAELYALCQALRLASEAGATNLVVTGDSDFVVQHLQGSAITAIPRLHTLLQQARDLMADFVTIRLVWVPRHRNTAANDLARAALGLAS